jgi:hypothetical protein
MAASLFGMLLLHLLEATVSPPARLPDLHAVAFASYSCVHFVLAYAAAVSAQWAAACCTGELEEHTPMYTRAGLRTVAPPISFEFPGIGGTGSDAAEITAPRTRAAAKKFA